MLLCKKTKEKHQYFSAANPTFSSVTYAATQSISDATGPGVIVASATFSDTDISIDDWLTLTWSANPYFDFVDNGDGTGLEQKHFPLISPIYSDRFG